MPSNILLDPSRRHLICVTAMLCKGMPAQQGRDSLLLDCPACGTIAKPAVQILTLTGTGLDLSVLTGVLILWTTL